MYVCPTIVMKENPISHISGVYNGIKVTSQLTGDIMYYGRGAGRFPTAGAVMSDVVAVLSGAVAGEKLPSFTKKAGSVRDYGDVKSDMYVRAACGRTELCDRLDTAAEKVEILSESGGVTEAVVYGVTAAETDKALPDARVIHILR